MSQLTYLLKNKDFICKICNKYHDSKSYLLRKENATPKKMSEKNENPANAKKAIPE